MRANSAYDDASLTDLGSASNRFSHVGNLLYPDLGSTRGTSAGVEFLHSFLRCKSGGVVKCRLFLHLCPGSILLATIY